MFAFWQQGTVTYPSARLDRSTSMDDFSKMYFALLLRLLFYFYYYFFFFENFSDWTVTTTQDIKIYQMLGQKLHAKTATFDGRVTMVGSSNLDQLSKRHSMEVDISISNVKITKEYENQFQVDLADCKELKLETWLNRSPWQKMANWFCYYMFRFALH